MINNVSELESYLSIFQPYRYSRNRDYVKSRDHHILFDTRNNRIIGCFLNVSTINKFKQFFPNVNSFLYANHCKTIAVDFDTRYAYQYHIDLTSHNISKLEMPSFDDMYHYALLNEKMHFINYLGWKSVRYIRRFANDSLFQIDIYTIKYKEAMEIIESNIDNFTEDTSVKYPFVYNYAKIENIDLLTAANNVKDQYNSFRNKILDIENLRLSFNKKIIECDDITKLPAIHDEFAIPGSLLGGI